ncbi:MAG: sel1 repeat family protein [Hyphomicrobiales bacterium]|nr:sel1 repeat family protein [Hyphomicrobiales bacterium]
MCGGGDDEVLGTSIQKIFENFAQILSIGRDIRGGMQEPNNNGYNRADGNKQMFQVDMIGISGEPERNFIELGMDYACGRNVAADLIEAHKWFNIAALRGDVEAARRRQELAAEMNAREIAAAQRRAREWLSIH